MCTDERTMRCCLSPLARLRQTADVGSKMKLRSIKLISLTCIAAYAIAFAAIQTMSPAFQGAWLGIAYLLGIAYVLSGVVLLFLIGMSWRCPSCFRYTIIFAKHCIRCGAELKDDAQGIMK